MRFNLTALFVFCFFISIDMKGQHGWAMLHGEASDMYLVKGAKGVPHHNNTPGARAGASWSLNGKLYVYGSENEVRNGKSFFPLADMWCYDTLTQNWTWLMGEAGGFSTHAPPVYGTQGVAAATNTPGFREGAVCWVFNGKLFLFGGSTYISFTILYNDMWMFDPVTNYWTWLGGGLNSNKARYGVQGVQSATNQPGAMSGLISWVHNDKLYMFGGSGYDSLNIGPHNEIWEYDPVNGYWTWVKGDKTVGYTWNKGTKNISSASTLPSVRYSAGVYYNGKFYLQLKEGDILFEFNHSTNNWTWIKGSTSAPKAIYGTKGVHDTLNTPGENNVSIMWEDKGSLYFLGAINNTGDSRSIWQYNIANKTFAWISGDSIGYRRTEYGIVNEADTSVWPYDILPGCGWQFGNKLYLRAFNGVFHKSETLWEYNADTRMWRWLKGMHNANSENFYRRPYKDDILNEPAYNNTAIWQAGDGIYAYKTDFVNPLLNTIRNILWRYDVDKNTWAAIYFSYSDTAISAGAGIPSVYNTPGNIRDFLTATIGNKLYLYGGVRNAGNSSDLWEFDLTTHVWTFLKGFGMNAGQIRGTQGVPAANNTPGAIFYGAGMVSTAGKLYILHGGVLWEYDPATNNWVWLKGGNTFAVYGTQGVPATTNLPGFRRYHALISLNNKIYMFGGEGYSESGVSFSETGLNDLWEYDVATNNWTWLSGDKKVDPLTVFGTKNVAAPNNRPGWRGESGITTLNGKIYLFGGEGSHIPSNFSMTGGRLNDMWAYDLSSGLWTWLYGDSVYVEQSNYEHKGVFDTINHIGPITYNNIWSYKTRLYSFGGLTSAANTDSGLTTTTNAIWSYETCDDLQQCYSNIPVINIDSIVTICDEPIMLNAGNVGSKFLWNTNDTVQTIYARQPGKYWVRVTNPGGKTNTDTVIVKTGTRPLVSLGADSVICVGDSVKLSAFAGQGCKYFWNTTDTSSSIYGHSGTYRVCVIGENGCLSEDTIRLETKFRPSKPIIGSNDPVCTGSKLHIKDSVLGWRSNCGYYRLNGHTGVYQEELIINNASFADSGIYILVDTLDGCTSADTIYVKIDSTFTPQVSLSVAPGVNVWPYVAVNFVSAVNYGKDSAKYQWTRNGSAIPNEVGSTYSAIALTDILHGDVICVNTTTLMPCATNFFASDCAQPLVLKLGIHDVLNSNGIVLIPNPVTDVLTVYNIKPGDVLYIYDMSGRMMVMSECIADKKEIDVSTLTPGAYILKVVSLDGAESNLKLIKH